MRTNYFDYGIHLEQERNEWVMKEKKNKKTWTYVKKAKMCYKRDSQSIWFQKCWTENLDTVEVNTQWIWAMNMAVECIIRVTLLRTPI